MPKIRAISIPGRREGEVFEVDEAYALVYTKNGQAELVEDEPTQEESKGLKRRAPVNRMLDTSGAGVDYESEGPADPST